LSRKKADVRVSGRSAKGAGQSNPSSAREKAGKCKKEHVREL